MKKTLNIVISLLLVVSLAGLGFGETFRQGGERITFHPTTIVAKTAAYTVTSSDSQVEVTCTSANITITLPAISSLRPGTKAFKIIKKDATAYAVIVTPATGDTVGGESTRYLLSDEAYIVISTSSGSLTDWTVNFETAYTAEDYEAGSVTLNGTVTIFGDISIDGTTPALTIGDAGAEDSQLNFDGNAQDFSIGLQDTTDKLVIGLGTTLGTTERMTFNSADLNILIGDATAADVGFIFDGNAQDFYIGLDDSADDLVIGLGSAIGTTPAFAIDENQVTTFSQDPIIAGTTPTVTIGDAGAEDSQLNFDGNAQDFSIGLQDSADKLVIGLGTVLGTTERMTFNSADLNILIGDATAADVAFIFDGNAQDFHIGIDDSADDLVFGVGSVLGTSLAMAIDSDYKVTIPTGLSIPNGAAPSATCLAGEIYLDTDESTDTNCTTTNDNSLCLCISANTWTQLNNN